MGQLRSLNMAVPTTPETVPTTTGFDPTKARSDFLIAMYNQLMNDISRHIVVIWQSVGVLFGAFALFALVEKNVLTFDIAASLQLILCIWVLAHVYDAAYWYNRNLVMIANIERQFLAATDLKDIHYYFGKHRQAGTMLTHLKIQLGLALGVAAVVLAAHFLTNLLPIFQKSESFKVTVLFPWTIAVIGLFIWRHSSVSGADKYREFLTNSPGKYVDTTGIKYEVGHPPAT